MSSLADQVQLPVKRVTDYPVGRFERAILDLIADPSSTETFRHGWTIMAALRVSRPIDAKRLEQAFAKVVARHETLRARFAHRPEGWRLIVEDRHRTGPVVTNLGNITPSELRAKLDEAEDLDFDVTEGPLFRLDLLKCGSAGDVLLTRAHHLITDGWSMILVADELVRAGFGLPITGEPLSYGDYLKRFEKAPSPAEEEQRDAYWQRLLLPALPRPNLGRVKKGLAPNFNGGGLGPAERITHFIEPAAFASLQEVAKSLGATLSNIVGAAFASVLAKEGGVEGVYINVPFAGRNHPDLKRFAGFVCDYIPVRCDVAAAGSVAELAKAIGEQIRSSFQQTPSGATKFDAATDDLVNSAGGHLRQFECGMLFPESAARQSLLSPLLASDAGQTIRLGPVEIEMLELAKPLADTAELNIHTHERKGGLDLILSYDTEAIDASEAETILAGIVSELMTLRG